MTKIAVEVSISDFSTKMHVEGFPTSQSVVLGNPGDPEQHSDLIPNTVPMIANSVPI